MNSTENKEKLFNIVVIFDGAKVTTNNITEDVAKKIVTDLIATHPNNQELKEAYNEGSNFGHTEVITRTNFTYHVEALNSEPSRNDIMIEQLSKMRLDLDAFSKAVKDLKPVMFQDDKGEEFFVASHQLERCEQSLLLAKGWLGKMRGELGQSTPYKNDGKRKEVKDIEPTADAIKPEEGITWSEDMSHIQKVDWLRQDIDNSIKGVIGIDMGANRTGLTREFAIARTNAYTHLCEARFHLGFELQRIKEEAEFIEKMKNL